METHEGTIASNNISEVCLELQNAQRVDIKKRLKGVLRCPKWKQLLCYADLPFPSIPYHFQGISVFKSTDASTQSTSEKHGKTTETASSKGWVFIQWRTEVNFITWKFLLGYRYVTELARHSKWKAH